MNATTGPGRTLWNEAIETMSRDALRRCSWQRL